MKKSLNFAGLCVRRYGYVIPSKLAALSVALALCACGGGSDGPGGGSSSNDSTYYGVTGVKNGSATTICLENAAFIDPKSANGKGVTDNIVIFYKLTGSITTLSGTGQSCASNFPLATTNITVSYYNSVVIPGATIKPTIATVDPTVIDPVAKYVTWADSSNGVLLRDTNNDFLAVDSSDRAVYFYPGTTSNPTRLNGLTVNSNAQILDNGQNKGYIGLTTSTSGGKIAALFCNSGRLMDVKLASTGWSIACSGDTTGGGQVTPPGSTNTTRQFITWTGSTNGTLVRDANNESFAFYADTRCLYSYNRQQETSNFCLATGSSSGSFAGRAVQVLSVTGDTGGCIAALADPSGFQIDIVTNSAGIQTVNTSSSKWVTTGCTR